MVAYASYSPAFKIDKAIPDWKTKLPRVSRMSDVLWIQWAYIAEQDGTPEKVSQLEYIFRYDVVTPNTKFIIEQAAAIEEEGPIEEGEFDARWPGYEFALGDDRFTALLGTVHGTSIVDLLVTHVNELGTKSIKSVTIFTTDGDSETGEVYHMLWTLKD